MGSGLAASTVSGHAGERRETDSVAGVVGLELGKCRFTKRWAELLALPEYFVTRDFFARTAKGLIGGAEPLFGAATVSG
jgi:hypothetical protein